MTTRKTTRRMGGTLALLALSVLAGCGGSDDNRRIVSGPPAAQANIVTPAKATIARGAQQQFEAALPTGAKPVWNVRDGGSITDTGLYTAPTTPGTYTIYVYDASNASVNGAAVITVP